ncbi:RDD family protein [compost metagenome]
MLLIEVGVYGCCGNTAGKALLGITVTTLEGTPLTAAQYLRRQLGVFCYGFALGLPVISLMAMANQGLCLRNGQTTAYDAGRFLVRVRR